ncbi:MAG: flagellar motor switch phosphatase FliY [Clostridiales bacterium]|nr:flagellar motor switch phosphatase FliY [Clostridiales bacterium]
MGDMLSQAEIDALLGGPSEEPEEDEVSEPEMQASPMAQSLPDNSEGILTVEQKDILGEIGNISMGTAATTLFALLGKKVWITTPVVHVSKWGDIQNSYRRPCVGTRIDYKEGLKGSNILILNQHDVKVITNLMMGGDGSVAEDAPLDDIDLSAIGEAMNQMIGSASTSLSSLIKLKIDIDTPNSFLMDFSDSEYFESVNFDKDENIVSISFRMEIDTLIDSQIMQILPVQFAVDMVEKIKVDMLGGSSVQSAKAPAPSPAPAPQMAPSAPQYEAPAPQMASSAPQYEAPPQYQQPQYEAPPQQMAPPQYQPQPQMAPPQYQQPYEQQPMYYQQPPYQQSAPPPQNVNVQPVKFQNFDVSSVMQQKENMGIIMDVPLEVTVELGRTSKKIKDILEFTPGTIVELDKLAGEPIDILVNGKFVAKGEVVVVMDENFGVRITDIISVEDRI